MYNNYYCIVINFFLLLDIIMQLENMYVLIVYNYYKKLIYKKYLRNVLFFIDMFFLLLIFYLFYYLFILLFQVQIYFGVYYIEIDSQDYNKAVLMFNEVVK